MNLNQQKTNAKFWLSAVMILIAGQLLAATGVIKGRVVDERNQPIEFAQATLLSSKNMKMVKGQVCNAKGEFVIDQVKPGEYILSVTMMGYVKNESEKVVVDPKTNTVVEKKVTLSEATHQLKSVEVKAKKQFIEQTVDKMVINPEASITSASENVYEILKKLPGVIIDNKDNISLKGKEGVKVMIDDKPTYVSSDQLAALLKGMQGKNVDRIEIIENPSARYDAEGNSGIINIKTKHNRAPGFNGSVNGGMNIASKFAWNGGLDLNMNYGKLNVYANYSQYNWAGFNSMEATRNFTSESLKGSSQLINTNGNYKGLSHNYKIGADYYLKKNHVISVMFRGNTGHNDNLSDKNRTDFVNSNKQIDSTLITTATSTSRWQNETYNLNYKWDIDSTGQSLSADFDYAHFYYKSPNEQNGIYYNSIGNSSNHTIAVKMLQENGIDIYTAKMDYVLPIGKKYNFEAGAKLSSVTTDSKMDMSGYLNQNDHFKYEEDILAAYVNGRAQLKKTSLQLGLRMENTKSTGNSITGNSVIPHSYLKLFPSVFIQQAVDSNQNVNFNYSYRIGRPSYDNLNPFRWMVDPYTYNEGNPYLMPQYTHALGLSHSYKNALITCFGYNYTKSLFTEVIIQNDETKTIYQTTKNLSHSTDFNLSETFQFQPTKWWRLNSTITGVYKSMKMDDGSNSDLEQWGFYGNMSNNFNLPYKIDMELSGNYSSKQLISNIVMRPRYTINLGLQRKVLKDMGVLRIAIDDIFKTGCSGAYSKYGNVDLEVKNRWDSRRLKISFSYRFGKSEFKTRSNRSTASSEEQSRSAK